MMSRIAKWDWANLMWLTPIVLVGLTVAVWLNVPIIDAIKDPNLKITFSCQGDRVTKRMGGNASPDVSSQKVYHSVTFWRSLNDEAASKKSLSKYKIEKYSIDGNIVNIIPSNKNEKVLSERLGYVNLLENRRWDYDNGGYLVDSKTIKFNFISKSMDVWGVSTERKTRNGDVLLDYVTEVSQCDRVTDRSVLRETSVIEW